MHVFGSTRTSASPLPGRDIAEVPADCDVSTISLELTSDVDTETARPSTRPPTPFAPFAPFACTRAAPRLPFPPPRHRRAFPPAAIWNEEELDADPTCEHPAPHALRHLEVGMCVSRTGSRRRAYSNTKRNQQ